MRQLRDILAASVRGGSAVLGTVVDVRGSSYRKPGARVLVREDGSRVGLISGGCLEKDVVRNAFAWTEDGPRVVLYDTRGDELNPQGDYGTGCDGLVWLLMERTPVDAGIDPLAEIGRVWETGRPAVMATVYRADDETALGARAVLSQDAAAVAGELGDPLRAAIAGPMRDAFDWPRPRSVELRFGDDVVSFLVEPLRPPPELVVFGAGDDAQPLVRMGSTMGWTCRVADRWPALVTRSRFPEAEELVCEPTEKLVDRVSIRPGASVVVMTHALADDATLLPALLGSDAGYIGLLGPRRRTARLMRMLAERGELPAPEDLDRLQTPAGLDLGGERPEEVAVSIVGAITAHRNERSGGVLQEADGSIHPEHETIVREVE